MQAVSDFVSVRLEQVEFGRITEPPCDQCRCFGRTLPLPQAGWNQRGKLGIRDEALSERRLVLRGDRAHESRPEVVSQLQEPTPTQATRRSARVAVSTSLRRW